jgi:hypothetical protein
MCAILTSVAGTEAGVLLEGLGICQESLSRKFPAYGILGGSVKFWAAGCSALVACTAAHITQLGPLR